MEGEETKSRGQESELNGNTIFYHPGDGITILKNPTIINSLAVKLRGFTDWSASYMNILENMEIRITANPHMPPPRFNLIICVGKLRTQSWIAVIEKSVLQTISSSFSQCMCHFD